VPNSNASYAMRYPLVPQIDWDQTDTEVKLNVWIPGVEEEDLECTLGNTFLRVRVEPYLLEVDFHGVVAVHESSLEILNQGMRFMLKKVRLPTSVHRTGCRCLSRVNPLGRCLAAGAQVYGVCMLGRATALFLVYSGVHGDPEELCMMGRVPLSFKINLARTVTSSRVTRQLFTGSRSATAFHVYIKKKLLSWQRGDTVHSRQDTRYTKRSCLMRWHGYQEYA
jgi:hypothetical protein